MAGNSVPAFFGVRGKTLKPVSIDVTFTTDQSGSMSAFVAFVSSISTIVALENALTTQGVGISQDNRYSLCSGAGGAASYDELDEIEYSVTVNSVLQRWAPGPEVVAGNVVWPSLSANAGGDTEDVALAAHLIAGGAREYQANAQRIIVAAGDLQTPYLEDVVDNSVALATLTAEATAQRYIGVHKVDITFTEPASANPVPPGSVFGFVYTTDSVGTAIYFDGNTLYYREGVDVSKVTLSFAGVVGGNYAPISGQADEIFAFAEATNGAIYNLALTNTTAGTEALGVSLGQVLGQYLYATES